MHQYWSIKVRSSFVGIRPFQLGVHTSRSVNTQQACTVYALISMNKNQVSMRRINHYLSGVHLSKLVNTSQLLLHQNQNIHIRRAFINIGQYTLGAMRMHQDPSILTWQASMLQINRYLAVAHEPKLVITCQCACAKIGKYPSCVQVPKIDV